MGIVVKRLSKPEKQQRIDDTAQLISAEVFANKLGLSRRTLQRLQSKGVLPPPIRIGGSIRWRLDVVDEWIDNGCPSLGESV